MNVPLHEIKTLFLDVGNTLNSVNFSWICEELERLGIPCGVEELRRAEAAARPTISEGVKHLSHKEGLDVFHFYLTSVLARVPGIDEASGPNASNLALDLAPILRPPGSVAADLWSYVLPGVEDALMRFKQAGLSLAAVSNADGTVEDALRRQGLRDYFEVVIDSGAVGFEKPDPRIFRHTLSVMVSEAQETLHVGDIFDVDVVGARSAGIHALLIDPFGDWDHVDCDRVADLTELADLVEAQS